MSGLTMSELYDLLPKGIPVSLQHLGEAEVDWSGPDAPTGAEAGEALQRAILRARIVRGACVNPLHDHTTRLLLSGDMVGKDVALLCWTCGQPAHCDLLMSSPGKPVYCHDSFDAPACEDMDPNWVNPCQTRRQS